MFVITALNEFWIAIPTAVPILVDNESSLINTVLFATTSPRVKYALAFFAGLNDVRGVVNDAACVVNDWVNDQALPRFWLKACPVWRSVVNWIPTLWTAVLNTLEPLKLIPLLNPKTRLPNTFVFSFTDGCNVFSKIPVAL